MIFDYNLVRSNRKSVAIQVDSDCNITVRAPLRISQKEIDKILLEKKAWLEKTIILRDNKEKYIRGILNEQRISIST